MKKYLFAALLMAAPTLVFAQLKVSSNGSVEIGVGNTSRDHGDRFLNEFTEFIQKPVPMISAF